MKFGDGLEVWRSKYLSCLSIIGLIFKTKTKNNIFKVFEYYCLYKYIRVLLLKVTRLRVLLQATQSSFYLL